MMLKTERMHFMPNDRIILDNIPLFEKNLRENEKADNTVLKYLRDVKAFAKYLGERELCKNELISYKNSLITQYKARSVNSMLASVNAFLLFLDRSDCIIKSVKIQRDLFCEERKELSAEEYERLCQAADHSGNTRLHMLLQTLCATGIRVSELKFVTVEAVKKGEATVSLKGKTRKIIFVKKLCKKLLAYIREQKICSGPIFVTRTGHPLNRTSIWREMKKLCRAANVDESKVFPHNLRHLFARTFFKIKKDITMLADILGHSNIETTRIYLISDGDEHRKTMEQMCLIT